MKALRNYLKKPLMAIFVGLLLFLWDHLILWPNGIFLYTDPEVWVVSIPIFAFCAAILLLIGKYRSTDWAWLFAGVAFHFLLIPIMLVPLCEHHKMEIGVLTGMVFAYFTSQRSLVQYPLLAALVGTIGWLLSKKKQPEVSETPDA